MKPPPCVVDRWQLDLKTKKFFFDKFYFNKTVIIKTNHLNKHNEVFFFYNFYFNKKVIVKKNYKN